MGALLRAVSLDVSPGRVEACIACDPTRMRTSDVQGLALHALEHLPGLARHACENGLGLPPVRELADTEVAHLVEHVAIELLLRGAPTKGIRGGTVWDFRRDGAGVFRVTLEHPDDLATLAAIKGALLLVEEWAVGRAGEPAGAVARVREATACRRSEGVQAHHA